MPPCLQQSSGQDPNQISVSDLCVPWLDLRLADLKPSIEVTAVKNAMGSFGGSQVLLGGFHSSEGCQLRRFVGHSLGAQLAARCASLLHSEEHPAAPQRLALLEPYFSKHSRLP